MRRYGLIAKLFAQKRVLKRGVIAGHRCANCTPGDPVTRLIETHQRRLEAIRLRQQVGGGHANLLQGETRSHRSPQRPLAVYVVRRKAWSLCFYEKSANFTPVLLALGPDHRNIGNRSRGDPHLLPIQDILVALASSASAHTTWI